MAAVAKLVSAPASIIRFIREAFSELKKVAWPSREATVRYTVIVVASSLAMGLIIGGIDYLLTIGVETFIIK